MQQLVGKTIMEIYVNHDGSALCFVTDQGQVNFEVWGDCCSESWFSDINGVGFLINGLVNSADEVGMGGYNVEDGRTRQGCDTAYGYKIKTNKGDADIVFRNSSNGYYGGSIKSAELFFDVSNMKKIDSDWLG